MNEPLVWKCLHFKDLTLLQLHDLMKIRQEVFVVEQDCPYLDADGKDLDSWHLFAESNGEVVACTRLVPKGVSYPDAVSIGRVATSQKIRGQGVGKELMQHSIKWIQKIFPDNQIRISAQTYLKKYYESFDFVQYTEEYLEDDIPHIGMVRK